MPNNILKTKWTSTPSSDIIEMCQRMYPAVEHLFINGAYDAIDRYNIKLIDEICEEYAIRKTDSIT